MCCQRGTRQEGKTDEGVVGSEVVIEAVVATGDPCKERCDQLIMEASVLDGRCGGTP
jgi:hypothetical protein